MLRTARRGQKQRQSTVFDIKSLISNICNAIMVRYSSIFKDKNSINEKQKNPRLFWKNLFKPFVLCYYKT